MKGDHYIVMQMGEGGYRHVIGQRHVVLVAEGDALWSALCDVSPWKHGHRIGERKRGLLGWKTLAGLKRSYAYRWRTETLYYLVQIYVENAEGELDLVETFNRKETT